MIVADAEGFGAGPQTAATRMADRMVARAAYEAGMARQKAELAARAAAKLKATAAAPTAEDAATAAANGVAAQQAAAGFQFPGGTMGMIAAAAIAAAVYWFGFRRKRA